MKRGRGGGGLDAIENRRIRKERGHLRAAAPFGLVFRVVLVAVSRRVLGCGERSEPHLSMPSTRHGAKWVEILPCSYQ